MKRVIAVPAVVWLVCAVVVLAMVSMPQVGLAEQPLEPFVAVAQTQGSLASVSWTVVSNPGSLVKDQAPTVPGQHPSAYIDADLLTAWLDLHGGRSRPANREPDLLRYDF